MAALTYVLAKIKRTVLGQKIVDAADIDYPSEELSSVAVGDKFLVLDIDADEIKFVQADNVAHPNTKITQFEDDDRILFRDSSADHKLRYIFWSDFRGLLAMNRNGARVTSRVTLTNGVFVDVISTTITPSSASAKIRVSLALYAEDPDEESVALFTIQVLRGSTEIIADFKNSTGAETASEPIVAWTVDSPGSTSEQTYKFQVNASAPVEYAGVGSAILVEEL